MEQSISSRFPKTGIGDQLLSDLAKDTHIRKLKRLFLVDGTSRGEDGLLWSVCRGKLFEWLDDISVEGLLFKVREIYGLDEEATFRNVTISSERPLYSTATQIGVIPTDEIPSLLKVLLPSNYVSLPVFDGRTRKWIIPRMYEHCHKEYLPFHPFQRH